MKRLVLIPAVVWFAAFTGCGRVSCDASLDKSARLIQQLRGKCCEFSTEPTQSQPDRTCKAVSQTVIRNSGRECIRSAAECLGQLEPGPSAVPALIEAVRTGPGNYDTGDGVIPVRDAILKALGHTGDPRALPVLLDALENPRPVEAAPGAIGYASKEPVGEAAALHALGLLGPLAKPAVPRIGSYLKRSAASPRDLNIIRAAASALGNIGDESAIPALTEALKRKYVAGELARALATFGGQAQTALPAIEDLLREDPDREGNAALREAVRRIAGSEAFRALPKSYDVAMKRIADLLQAAARRAGRRIRGIDQNQPRQMISLRLADGQVIRVDLDQAAWKKQHVEQGLISGSDTGWKEAFRGIQELEKLISRALR